MKGTSIRFLLAICLAFAGYLWLAPAAYADVEVDPQEIETELNTGDIEATDVTISNLGDDAIDWDTDIEVTAEPDEERVGPRRDRRSEPDDMGWEWRDNMDDNADGAPEFVWIDTPELDGVREFRLGDDANTGAVDLGWEFPFWDRMHSRVFADSDGWMSFTYGGRDIMVTAANFPYNAADGARGGNTVSIFNDDNTAGTEVYIWTNQNDEAVIEWHGDHRFKFQLLLYGSGLGVMQYGEAINQNTGEIGVNRGADRHGWFISARNNQYAVPGRVIAFGGPNAWTQWITVDPTDGSIDGDDAGVMVLTLDADGLIGGNYRADVHILTSEDQDIVIAVDLTVQAAPNIVVEWSEDHGFDPEDPDACVVDWNLAYDDVFVGGPYEMTVTVTNTGIEDLDIEDIYSEHDYFSADPEDLMLEPDASADVTFIFNAADDDPDDFDATMVFVSNDPSNGEYVVALHAEGTLPPAIEIDPGSIEDDLVSNEVEEHTLTVSNDGDAELRFTIESEIISEPGDDEERDNALRTLRSVDSPLQGNDNEAGPRRDDLGDLIHAFQSPNAGAVNRYNAGIAWDWDNEWMWMTNYSPNFLVSAIDPANDYEVEREFRVQNNPMGAACYDGELYIVHWSNNWLYHYNTEGENLGNIQTNFRPTAVTVSHEEGLLFVMNDANNREIRVFDIENDLEQIAVIPSHFQYTGNFPSRSICWVDKHPDGQMWFNTRRNGNGNELWQVSVDVDDWTYIEQVAHIVSWPAENGQEWDGIGHDGHNLWLSQYPSTQIRIIDDGVAEMYWLMYEPDEGTIAVDGDPIEIDVTLDATDLIGGDYEADMTFFTNDPDDDEVVISVIMHVTGVPALEVAWSEDHGFDPDNGDSVVDFNAAHEELYAGHDYPVTIELINPGTDDTEIESITCENQRFTCDPADAVIIGHSSLEVNFIFNSEDTDQHEAVMVIVWNDPADEPADIEINLVAQAFTPPAFELAPGSVEEDYFTGDIEEHVLTLSNTGGADLNWSIASEIIAEPGDDDRDNASRTLRSTARRADGPRRDPLEDNELDGLLFAAFQINSTWGWVDDGMRQDPLLNNDNYHSYRQAGDWDNVDFSEYDVIVVAARSSMNSQNYQNNFERLEEYVDGGGACYYETADANSPMHGPGDIVNNSAGGTSNGTLVVSPDPNDDNYSLFAEICHRSEPNYWEEGEIIEGGSWLHSGYLENQFVQKVEDGTLEWYQVIATKQNQDVPGAVAYGFGKGTVLTVGHPTGHCWFNYARNGGEWGSMASEILLYLTEMGGAKWLAYEPDEGTIEADDQAEVTVTLDCSGLFTGDYEADMTFTTNDPDNEELVFNIIMHVTGAPALGATWSADIGWDEDPEVAVIDWNLAYLNLFVDQTYDVLVEIENTGTDDLEIEDIYCENDLFTSDPVDASLEPGESDEFTFTFDASSGDAFEEAMVIVWNDPNEEDFEIALLADAGVPPEIAINPGSIEEDLYTGGLVDVELTVANEGEADLRFTVEHEIVAEPDRDANARSLRSTRNAEGPRRDDFMDVIATYRWARGAAGYKHSSNFDTDNEWMWVATYSPNWIAAISWDGDYENFTEEIAYQPQGQNVMDIAWMDGVVYNVAWSGAFVGRHDAEGENLGNLPMGFNSVTALAASPENGVLIAIEGTGAWGMHVVRPVNDNVERVATINWRQGPLVNQFSRGICWVDEHPDGQLWINTQSRLMEVSIDTDDWSFVEVVQNTAWNNGNDQWSDPGHDGENLWLGVRVVQEFQIVDDGIAETNWLAYDPVEGTVAGDDAMIVTVTLDGAGLAEGDYEADLTFLSNDPNEEEGVVINIQLHLTAASDIEVEWSEDFGYPDVLNWNPAYEDVFAGGPYTMVVQVSNEGTADLDIEDIFCDNEYFTVDQGDMLLEPDASANLTITFEAEADDPGEYEEVMTFVCDDPDEENFELPMHVICELPPIIRIVPGSIETDLFTGGFEEHDLVVENSGDAELRFTTDIEIIVEPGDDRDNASRTLRSTRRADGPRRDRRGGPDDMGYEWRDNLEDDGPEYEWIDIREFEGVREFVMGDDAITGAVELGWDFPFYVENFNRIFIDTDGWAGFVRSAQSINTPRPFPQNQAGWFYTLAILNGDWHGSGGGGPLYTWTNERDLMVITYHNWNSRGGIGGCFQIILNDAGMITFQYGDRINDIPRWWQASHTGINGAFIDNNMYGFSMVNYGQGQDYIVEGRAIGCGPAGAWTRWVSVDPAEGAVEGDDEMTVTVFLDAAGLIEGDWEADIHFLSNDPASPDEAVNVLLHVTGAPDIEVTWDEAYGYIDPIEDQNNESVVDWNLMYEDLFTGGPYEMTVILANLGTADLDVEDIFCDHDYFSVEPQEAFLEWEDGEDVVVTITFDADVDDPNDFEAELVFISNDPDEDELIVNLHAEASLPPVFELSVDGDQIDIDNEDAVINDDLVTGEQAEHAMEIYNAGDALLRWRLEAEIIRQPGDEEERDNASRTLRSTKSVTSPRRDNPGDRLEDLDFNHPIPANQYKNGCYDPDNEWFWFQQYNNPYLMAAIDPSDGEEMVRFNTGLNPMDLAYYDGVIYIMYLWVPTLNRYDIEGNNLGALALQGHRGINGVATDQEEGLIYAVEGSGAPFNLSVFNLEGERIGQIGNIQPFVNNQLFRSIEFVALHPDGELWVNTRDRAWQIDIDTDNFEFVGNQAVVNFPTRSNNEYAVIAHDGENLYVSCHADSRLYCYDDGVSEVRWLDYGVGEEEMVKEGTVEADDIEEIIVLLNADGLIGGMYVAEMYFTTNDPAHRNVTVTVNLDVTGVPDFAIEWGPGFDPDDIPNSVVDFNVEFNPNLFNGGADDRYQIPVTIINVGTDDLIIDEIIVDTEGDVEVFFVDPADFVDDNAIIAAQEGIITVSFMAEEAGEYIGTVTLSTNDPDLEEFIFDLSADCQDPPMISLDPGEIEREMDTGDEEELTINVANIGRADLHFTTEAEMIQEGPEEERDNASRTLRSTRSATGPRRDEPGDLIAQFNGINVVNHYSSCVGWDWDNERMWVSNYNNQRAAAYSHDANYENFNEEISIATGGSCMDGCWLNGHLWIGNWSNAQVRRYDGDGQLVGTHNFPFVAYGLAADVEESLIFVMQNAAPNSIHVYEVDGLDVGEEIGVIANHQAFHGNVVTFALEWVPAHVDAPLWMTDAAQNNVYQIGVDRDDWTCVEVDDVVSFQVNNGQPYCAVGHDGEYIWCSGYQQANIRVYDDGVDEVRWFSYDPKESPEDGLGADEEMDIFITINTFGLYSGEYEVNLHFLSNDPANQDAVVNILIHVSGAPGINVIWPEEWGYIPDDPDDHGIVDWNAAYSESEDHFWPEILYADGDYDLEIVVQNVGTEDLEIEGCEIDHEFFEVDHADFVIGPGEEEVVTLTFMPGETGEFTPDLIIFNNDEDDAEYAVSLVAQAFSPPMFSVAPQSIDTEVPNGQEEIHNLNVANEAGDDGAQLHFETEIEIISEPERDNNARTLNAVGSVGARRDPLEDDELDGLLFAAFQTSTTWGWVDDGMRRDPLLNNDNYHSYRQAADWDNVEFEDYDVIVIAARSTMNSQNYQNNFERLEEYVADGGACYYETADANSPMHGPGDIVNNSAGGTSNGTLVVSPDPNDDNYSLFAEICHRSEPNYWEEGELIEGGSWLHSGYLENQFVQKVDDGTLEWYQVIATKQNQDVPGAVAYGFGKGTVLTVGHSTGHCWFNYARNGGEWGSIASELLLYLTEMGGAKWITLDPDTSPWDPDRPNDSGIDPGADMDVFVTLNTEGLIEFTYEADIIFITNDPENDEFVVNVIADVIGVPIWDEEYEPIAQPFENAQDIEFEDTYVNGDSEISITVVNCGSTDLIIDGVEFTGDAADDYSTDIDDQAVLDPEQELAFTLTFSPSQTGVREATFSIFSDAENQDIGDDDRIWWDLIGVGELAPIASTDPETDPDNPTEIIVQMLMGDDPVEEIIVLANEEGERRDLHFEIEIEDIEEEERDDAVRSLRSTKRAIGPRRDQPEGRGILIAERCGWSNWDFERYFQAIDDLDYDRYRTWNQVQDVDFTEYDFMWIGNYEADAWVAQYNQNLERIEEFVDGGGALYHSSGTNNHNTRPTNPGGLVYNGSQSQNQCPLQLDPEENFLINYMNENDPFNWEWGEGQRLVGGGCAHGVFLQRDIDNMDNVEWVQIMAMGNPTNEPIILTYQYGRGFCLVSTTVDGYLHNVPANYHWGRTGEAVIWYLDHLANVSTWVTAEPDEGDVHAGESTEIILTFDPADLEDWIDYHATVTILTNDPENAEIVFDVELQLGARIQHFAEFETTNLMHYLSILDVAFDEEPVPNGWEIAAYTDDDVLAGGVVWRGEGSVLIAYGAADDVEGFENGDNINYRAWDPDADEELLATAEIEDNAGPRVWVNNGETIVTCVTAYQLREQTILHLEGWNMISLNIIPIADYWENLDDDDGPDVELMLEQYKDEDDNHHVVIMKDEAGDFCVPDWDFYGIDFWNTAEGYLMNVNEELEASWLGVPIHPQTVVAGVDAGWNIVAYYPTYDLEASRGSGFHVVSSIVDNVIIAKDGPGGFMVPSYGFSNMEPWTPGQGYQINVDEDVELLYPEDEDQGAALMSASEAGSHWASPVKTDVNMSVLVTSIIGTPVEDGDQIAAFDASGKLIGVGTISDEMCGLPIWGDSEHTKNVVDGLQEDEAFTLRMWNNANETEVNLKASIKSGKGLVYLTNALTIIDVRVDAGIPDEYSLSQNYPNPFNAVTRINYGLPEAAKVTINVFDVTGRLVTTLINNELKAGRYTAVWDGAGMTSGIYIVRMEAANFKSVRKVMLVK
ncbi:MAG: choice-of-anchor D domain-containing protein [Candidatus Hatepunaea meridiana]|nr:choice-of-anchor D domain-containing protein [Candidatus Hatepunaea meridiana]